jgi:prepilin-type N-terminal cleavage/methylation domain-containing protein
MKPSPMFSRSGRPLRPALAAFTLVEIMVAMAIFSLVVVAVLYGQLFGMRLFNVTATKLSASQGARAALNRVRDEIRSGKMLYVGSGNGGGFTNIPDNQPQLGNALQIYPTANTNSFVRYFLDMGDQKLKRKANAGGRIEVIASYITNLNVFRAEDCAGNVLTNDDNNRVINMTLDFYQWEFPVARVGAGAYYDYYRLQTRITRRAIE